MVEASSNFWAASVLNRYKFALFNGLLITYNPELITILYFCPENNPMKISNETKVGTLTAIAITLLILGFNYLKGKSISTRNDQLYGVFANVEGLQPSNPV